MSKDTGGPAFPVVHDIPASDGFDRAISVDAGMTLLDYFAAKVLQGFAANPANAIHDGVQNYRQAAIDAYALADFMLRVRAK